MFWELFLQVDRVLADRVIHAARASDPGTCRQMMIERFALDERFELFFGFVGQLVTIATEYLDAVVFEGIMRCG